MKSLAVTCRLRIGSRKRSVVEEASPGICWIWRKSAPSFRASAPFRGDDRFHGTDGPCYDSVVVGQCLVFNRYRWLDYLLCFFSHSLGIIPTNAGVDSR